MRTLYHRIVPLAIFEIMWHYAVYNVHNMYNVHNFWSKQKRRIYLDHAAATPLLPEAVRAMRDAQGYSANPSAIHRDGVVARTHLETARAHLARTLAIRPTGVIFTGSGTESNNLALLGTIYARHSTGRAFSEMEVVTTAIEHPSVLETVRHLASLGVVVKYLSLDAGGSVAFESLTEALTPKTVLVTLAYVNSEIGVVQPVGRIGRTIRAFEKSHGTKIVFHLDAAQAPLWLPCQLDQVHADIVSLDAGKCGGPKGVGVVAMRHGVVLKPVLFGGPQEGGLRPATENLSGIVGGVAALVAAQDGYKARAAQMVALRDQFITALVNIDGVVLNGDRTARVANNVNISIPGIDSEFAVICLDEAGIACSTKSACSGAGGGGSHVIMAISGDAARATSTIRFTLGPTSTAAELTKTTTVLKGHVEKMLTFQKNIVI